MHVRKGEGDEGKSPSRQLDFKIHCLTLQRAGRDGAACQEHGYAGAAVGGKLTQHEMSWSQRSLGFARFECSMSVSTLITQTSWATLIRQLTSPGLSFSICNVRIIALNEDQMT